MALEQLGSLFSGFSQGYLSAKDRERARDDEARTRRREEADHLLSMLPLVAHDPERAKTLLSTYAQKHDEIDNPPKATKVQQQGLGGLFKRMLGINEVQEAPPSSTSQDLLAKLMQEQTSKLSSTPPTREPGSETHGSLGNFHAVPEFGSGYQPPNAAPVKQPAGPQWQTPAFGSGVHAPSATPPTPQAQPQAPNNPLAQRYAVSYQNPQQMTQQAQATNPMRFMETPEAYNKRIHDSIAGDVDRMADTLVAKIDAWRDRTPGEETLAQAMADPEIRGIIDQLRKFEQGGLLGKDILAGRFADKAPEPVTIEQRVERGEVRPGSPEWNQWKAILDTKKGSGQPLSRFEQTFNAFLQQGMTEEEALRKVETITGTQANEEQRYLSGQMTPTESQAYLGRRGKLAQTVQAPRQPQSDLKAVRNRTTGQMEWARITEGVYGPQFTGVPADREFDLDSLMDSVPSGGFKVNPDGTYEMGGGGGKEYSALKVIEAVKNGDVKGPLLQLIIDSPQGTKAKATLEDFMRNPGKYQ